MIGDDHQSFSSRAACIACGASFPEIEPRLFSFNSPHGACPACDGLGRAHDVDETLIVPDPTISLAAGALAPFGSSQLRELGGVSKLTLPSLAAHWGFDLETPWADLDATVRDRLLHGSGDEEVAVETNYEGKNWKLKSKRKRRVEGVVAGLRKNLAKSSSRWLERFFAEVDCSTCEGTRLRPITRSVRFRERTIDALSRLCVDDLFDFFESVELEDRERPIGRPILDEIQSRLRFLRAVGLGYLTVERSAATLSGGESQRIRLATQVGSRLKGILYVLDEPSIGLHPRDNTRLIGTLESLRDLGNTVLVVEHDQETMERSDHVIDVGPGAGVHGGEIIHEGSYPALLKNLGSSTGAYLSGRKSIPIPEHRRAAGEAALVVEGASHNNLLDIDVTFPVGCFSVVTGASGSGKSSLVDDILRRALAAHYHGAKDRPGRHRRITGLEHFDKIIEIDQSPIGRTPRSNPATYTKVFDLIRDLFAQVPEAKARGWTKGRFSFNVEGGRCAACTGAGVKTIAMQFLPDVEVECEVCSGHRFNDETLQARYRERSIFDVLALTIEEAREFFANHPKIVRTLDALLSVGLGYLTLGQTATTLSGGEAQRVKLASELRRPATGRTLYLLDEPTTGLHFQDIEKLLQALQGLVDRGNTVIVVEHNLDVIKVADWVVDLGPDGGSGGGRLVYGGPFDGLLDCEDSYTADALRDFLGGKKRRRIGRRKKVRDLSTTGDIEVAGATLHNLKSVDVRIPSGSFTVITGPSGSGKTSLAFDTIFAEGQRRFVESLSAYARQFLGRLEKAPVDRIEGLSPAIAINQRNTSRNPLFTVATTPEIYDYFRLLWARIGKPHCPECDLALEALSPSLAASRLTESLVGAKGRLVAPIMDRGLKGLPADGANEAKKILADLLQAGFARVLIDDEEIRLDGEIPTLGKARRVWLVVDRVVIKPGSRGRLSEAIEQAYQVTKGLAAFVPEGGDPVFLTRARRCPQHGHELGELSPRMFSFNSHHGFCPDCHGIGELQRCSPELLVNRPEKQLLTGGMDGKIGVFFKRKSYFRKAIQALAKQRGFDIKLPWSEVGDADREAVLYGTDERVPFRMSRKRAGSKDSFEAQVSWPGLCGYVERWWGETESEKFRNELSEVMSTDHCRTCDGNRLRPESLRVRLGGQGIAEVCRMTVTQARDFVDGLVLSEEETRVAERALKEAKDRLRFLQQVGLEYLSLDRGAATLSGGEAQRIRLATQIGSRLSGVLYVLDEPTIGLHQRDVARLLDTLVELQALGNTIITVEHDEDTMDRADWIVDMGPAAGRLGGEVVFQGSRDALYADTKSLTAAYLTGRKGFDRPASRHEGSGKFLSLRGVRTNNLQNVDVDFPLGCMVGVTGVSGSGKSSLVVETLVPALLRTFQKKAEGRPVFDRLVGARNVAEMVVIDQAPIGRSPKSNPATYVGCFDDIRAIFATAPAARVKGFKPGRFSFNAAGGRCETCKGRGSVKVEMNFLADVWIVCEVCNGRRYNSETLTVEYKGKSIADVLEMEVTEALAFFGNHRRVVRSLQTLVDVGLGYLEMGQPANTLSGGEAQRIKLSRELARRPQGKILYVLDEPTTGLHFDDVGKLLVVLGRLVEQGHTVLVIEHNLDVALACDHLIDVGPEGGSGGGTIVASGTPEELMSHPVSYTGKFLAQHLKRRTGRAAPSPRRKSPSKQKAQKGAKHGCSA
ncbi:MAG: excinuclease ABC subunit UvrA [Planctomycetes bacterium]|nr:excinuclease ABC subunit UvrA [Planctomycetota bacterium]